MIIFQEPKNCRSNFAYVSADRGFVMATAAPPPDPTGLPPAAGSLTEEATVQQQTSQHPANELGPVFF